MKTQIDKHTAVTIFEFLGENWQQFKSWCESRGFDADEAYDDIDKATQ